MTNHYSSNKDNHQESWVDNLNSKLKVVREKIYAYLNEPYQEVFDVSENIVKLSSDAKGLNLALDYARLEADLVKHTRDDKSSYVEEKINKSSDVAGKRSKDLCEDFKVESMPSVMRKYVEDICKTTDAHPIMVASSVLTMLSGFMGTRVYVPNGVYWQDLYPNLWMLNITKSGSFKSSALSKGSKIAYDYSDKVSGIVGRYYEEMKNELDQTKKNNIHKKMVNVSIKSPVLPNKVTPEALLALLSQGHHGTIMSNEFGGWLANLENSQNGDLKALFTELYDGYSYRYYTKTQGDCYIKKPCFSINGVSNLPWIKEKIKPSDVESGFFARFLLYTPQFSTNVPGPLPEAKGTRKDVFMDESGIKNFLRDLKIRHDKEGDIRLDIDDDARQYFSDCHYEMWGIIKKDKPNLEEMLTPYLKRWSPYMVKIATIMQMVENPGSTHIGLAAMKGARSMVWPAIMSTIDLFENHLGMSDHQDKCKKVLKFMEDKYFVTEAPLTRQSICASEVLTGGSKDYTEVLNTLVDEGKISFRAGPTINTNMYTPLRIATRSNPLPSEESKIALKKIPIVVEEIEEYSAEAIERDYKMLRSLKNIDFVMGIGNGSTFDERL